MELYNFNLTSENEEYAKKIYNDSIVFDVLGNWGTLDNLYSLDEIINGGINAMNITIAGWQHDFYKAINQVVKYKGIINDNLNKFILVNTIEDFEKAKKQNKLAVTLHFQDSIAIGNNLDYLEVFYALGVKIIQLTYNAQNFVGSGCCELFCNKLTYFGREVIKKMNELGILIDLSHCSIATTLDAIELSKDPVFISHASVYKLCKAYQRNKTDKELKALASKGGVIGICFFPPLIKRNEKTLEVIPSTVEDVLDHIEYVINLVGVDHVAFGSDLTEWGHGTDSMGRKKTPPQSSMRFWRRERPDVFGKGSIEYYDPFPVGLQSHSTFINLSRGLVKRGFRESEIKKILGGNIINLLKKVWKE